MFIININEITVTKIGLSEQKLQNFTNSHFILHEGCQVPAYFQNGGNKA